LTAFALHSIFVSLSNSSVVMTRFTSLALLAVVGSAAAFAPVAPQSRAALTLRAATLAESPLTQWGQAMDDIVAKQAEMRAQTLPEFGPELSAKALGLKTKEAQLTYMKDNAMEIKMMMQEGGCVVFRDFDLMKEQDGFVQMYEALGMKTCLDPLHSVSARPTVDGSKNSPVYEAVNKESRKNFFIGMHNEFVGTRAPRAAAFVCFKPAEEGGEFLIADGRRIFRDLSTDLVKELYQRGIRYSVMELPFFGFVDTLPSFMQEPVMGAIKGAATLAINAKVDFDVELRWGQGGYDNVRMLQARAPSQPPIVLHPVTGDPTWFCNVHSHSSKLRKDREEVYGAERFEDGASQINKSDMFFGDDGDISEAALKEMDEVTLKNVRYVKMNQGDVVLLDNYKCMHGRNVFEGTRKHGVAWFEGWEGEEEMKQALQKGVSSSSNNNKKVPFFAQFQ